MAAWPYNTGTWQRLRKAHLQVEPFCRTCRAIEKRIVPADTVDHVHPISEGGPAFPAHEGLVSYCARCHSRKTARGPEAGAVQTRKPMKGCDHTGWPLDPLHPWNVEAARNLGAEDELD